MIKAAIHHYIGFLFGSEKAECITLKWQTTGALRAGSQGSVRGRMPGWGTVRVKSSSHRRRRRRITNGAPFTKPNGVALDHTHAPQLVIRLLQSRQAARLSRIEKVLAGVAVPSRGATVNTISFHRSRHTSMDHASLFRRRLCHRLS